MGQACLGQECLGGALQAGGQGCLGQQFLGGKGVMWAMKVVPTWLVAWVLSPERRGVEPVADWGLLTFVRRQPQKPWSVGGQRWCGQ